MIFRSPTARLTLFLLCNLLLVLIVYQRFEDPMAFAFIAGGIVSLSYFVLRAINQLVGD